MFYNIIYIIIILALWAHVVKKQPKKRLIFNFAVIILILVNGLRDPFLYHDNDNYYYFFKGDVQDEIKKGTLNAGYLMINSLIGFFTSSFQVFCFVLAAFFTCGYAKLIKTYSPFVWLSLLLYVLINYLPSFFLLRQYLAMPFVFWSFKYVIERKQLKYWLCILLAFSMHTTALVVIPIYYLYGLKYSKKNMLLVIAITVAASLGFMVIGAIVGSYFSYYSRYVEMEVEEPAWQRALMKSYILFVYMFALKKAFCKAGINRLIFYSMLLNVIICIGAMNIFGVFRLREYFSLADFIGVPIILYYTKAMSYPKKPVVIAMSIVYIILLVLSYNSFVEGGNMENGYQFFWKSNGLP